MNELLREVFEYLERSDVGGGIHCKRNKKGILEGPEERRFLIAEKVRNYLDSPVAETSTFNNVGVEQVRP